MKYNINRAIDYLAELTGCEVKMLTPAIREVDMLPFAIASCYSLCDIVLMETKVIIALPIDQEGISPMRLAKHQAKMMEIFSHPVVFVLESLASYNSSRLIRAKVNFIVPGKLIFIPSLLIVLRELKSSAKVVSDKMPPIAQLLVLYHIQKQTIDGLNASEIAQITGFAYSTINVALRWLNSNGIITLIGRKTRQIKIEFSKVELWNKSLPLMSSPVERILFTDKMLVGGLLAGETAMGHYTMLAEPTTPVIAIYKAKANEYATLINKQYGDIKVEIWKYPPTLLADGNRVDRLSLYLCMNDSDDERIQLECDTLIREMKW